MATLQEQTRAVSGIGRAKLYILGIRGIPAAHGGFETFAERLAFWMRDRGWDVTVYCQGSGRGVQYEDQWNGINRIHVPVSLSSSYGTIQFDIHTAWDVATRDGVILTLGYNTGFLNAWLRMRGRRSIINMDGLEWKRSKYSVPARFYLWINERLAAWSGSKLIADHPAIARHLETRARANKIATIPYGSDRVDRADATELLSFGLEPDRFYTVIARPEPENSILELVRGFSMRARGAKLAVLGGFDRSVPYQAAVLDAASAEVVFVGPVYDKAKLAALRLYSLAYLHGHRVGGTNPSLVEALGAGNAIIAHDNVFNRWVAGEAAIYFTSAEEVDSALVRISDEAGEREKLRANARARWNGAFAWSDILSQYEDLLTQEHRNSEQE